MRQLKKIYLLVACGLITASSMASSDQLKEQVTTGYKNKLLNNCQLVSEITMTPNYDDTHASRGLSKIATTRSQHASN
jgi:hypothetical protein